MTSLPRKGASHEEGANEGNREVSTKQSAVDPPQEPEPERAEVAEPTQKRPTHHKSSRQTEWVVVCGYLVSKKKEDEA
jgi:hypothetical protein